PANLPATSRARSSWSCLKSPRAQARTCTRGRFWRCRLARRAGSACAFRAAWVLRRAKTPGRTETAQPAPLRYTPVTTERKQPSPAQGYRASFCSNKLRSHPLRRAQQTGVIAGRADKLDTKRHVILAGQKRQRNGGQAEQSPECAEDRVAGRFTLWRDTARC